jgi:DNA-directed RNA polymerase III subunit RPC3
MRSRSDPFLSWTSHASGIYAEYLQISKITMMAAKDVRPLLSALSTDSLVSIQEVPKSADRNPTRTFYLWCVPHLIHFRQDGIHLQFQLRYVDLQKAYSVLLCDFYKILHNIRLRRRAEEEEPPLKAVLDKRERSDVSQDESLLTRMERDVLKEWESKRERLTILEMRVEEAAFILSGFDTLGFDDE